MDGDIDLAVFLVTWNLNKERTNYNAARTAFINHLEKLDNTYDPGLESVRFVSTAKTAQQLYDYLDQKIDANDKIIVTKLNSGEYQGFLLKSVWDWIDARI